MALPVLAVGGGAALLAASTMQTSDQGNASDYTQNSDVSNLDVKQGGILLSTTKVHYPAYGNLISQFYPISVPVQKSTHNLNKVYREYASDLSLASNQEVAYLFRDRLGFAPRSTADQSFLLVELPSPDSRFVADKNNVLNRYPLTYFNWSSGGDGKVFQPYMEKPFSRAGTSSENLMPRKRWPYDSYLESSNPWGPGGRLLDLWSKVQTDMAGTGAGTPPRPVVLQPPQ